jgi:hypothetical protein
MPFVHVAYLFSIPSTAYQGLQEVGVHVVLGERLDMSSLNGNGTNDTGKQGTRLIKTIKGREIRADLVVRGLRTYFGNTLPTALIPLPLLLSVLFERDTHSFCARASYLTLRSSEAWIHVLSIPKMRWCEYRAPCKSSR